MFHTLLITFIVSRAATPFSCGWLNASNGVCSNWWIASLQPPNEPCVKCLCVKQMFSWGSPAHTTHCSPHTRHSRYNSANKWGRGRNISPDHYLYNPILLKCILCMKWMSFEVIPMSSCRYVLLLCDWEHLNRKRKSLVDTVYVWECLCLCSCSM